MITSTQPYEVGTLPFSMLTSLENTFDHLPPDPYAGEKLRSRRYSRYKFHRDSTLERLGKKDFMQRKDINKYVGDVERTYEEIEESLSRDPVFLKMFEAFRAHTGLDENAVIEAHQIRWHGADEAREPAPEGMHQDGFDFIAMFMIDTANVEGGEILLYESKTALPLYKKRLKNGEFVVLNDKKLFHNASPLVRSDKSQPGHWDLIVLTANNQRN